MTVEEGICEQGMEVILDRAELGVRGEIGEQQGQVVNFPPLVTR